MRKIEEMTLQQLDKLAFNLWQLQGRWGEVPEDIREDIQRMLNYLWEHGADVKNLPYTRVRREKVMEHARNAPLRD